MLDSAAADAGLALSTSSVYPEGTERAFALAKDLGFAGIELMVGLDEDSTDVAEVSRLIDRYQVGVVSVHAPTLLVTQRVWGRDPWTKLHRSVEAAGQLGARVVVAHPPFRWQRRYAEEFTGGVRALVDASGVIVAVENMYPWRGPSGADLRAYAPSWDVGLLDCDHLTLDISHAAIARQSSLALVRDWGERLAHVHLCDGTSSAADEHMPLGHGDQDVAKVLAELASARFAGEIVLEIKTSRMTRQEREQVLADSLEFARQGLAK